jgi:hypothetical protein
VLVLRADDRRPRHRGAPDRAPRPRTHVTGWSLGLNRGPTSRVVHTSCGIIWLDSRCCCDRGSDEPTNEAWTRDRTPSAMRSDSSLVRECWEPPHGNALIGRGPAPSSLHAVRIVRLQ